MTAPDQLLPEFTWLTPEAYHRLHTDLWLGVSVPFKDRIEFLTPDDGWVSTMNVDDADLDETQARIGFIDLKTYPSLVILDLKALVSERGDRATFVVRHDYNLFFDHAMSRVNMPILNPEQQPQTTNFFLTGQSGIGKSYGSYYLLFRLLALKQPVFFVTSPKQTLYFSNAGVQKSSEATEYDATLAALHQSWVLIDVDSNVPWDCPKVFQNAQCIVWSSSPRQPCMHEFIKRFNAEKWHMRTWRSKEIAALTQRLGMDHQEVLERIEIGGPVAQSLFSATPSGIATGRDHQ
ncbi:hypothetical protein C8F01DRAFT_257678 [Mycena amicta]|nr:hypothetical protein C8F01DRAFT_257678 [Mycena amicta]